MRTPSRPWSVLAVVTVLAAMGCQNDRVEDEPPPGDVEMQSDTMMDVPADTMGMPDDTMGMTDAMGVDRSPTPADMPPEGATGEVSAETGGTTINYETGTATTPTGREVPVGGVTSGGVTTREGAAACDTSAPR